MATGLRQNSRGAEVGSSSCKSTKRKMVGGIGEWWWQNRKVGPESQMNAIQWYADKYLTSGSLGNSPVCNICSFTWW